MRFNLQTGTMYLEQEIYSVDGQVCETIMIQKNRTDDGSMWILRPSSFRLIGLSESQMQASTVVLTNQYGASTIQMPNVANAKLEPNDNTVCILSDSNHNICAAIDLSDIFLLKIVCMPLNPHALLCPRDLFVVTHLLNVFHYTLCLHL